MEIIINNIRVQFLSERVVRIEYQKNKNFLDENTFFVPHRDEYSSFDEVLVDEDSKYKILTFKGYRLFVPLKNRGLNGILVSDEQGRIIYTYKPLLNSGELPLLEKTPEIFPLMDSPHVIAPKEGYSVKKTSQYIVDDKAKDLYLLFCEKDFKLLRKLYIELTGRCELVRLADLGLWNSKYYEYDEESAKKVIDDYKKYQIPLDVMVIDTDWRKASDRGIGYDINDKLFPDMKRFFDYAHENNVEIVFNDHPEPVDGAKSAFDDKEIAFREEKLQYLLDLGLDGWWYDRNWHTKLISPTKKIEPETIGLYLFYDITENYYKEKYQDNKVYRRPVIMGNVNNIYNGTYKKINDSASHRYSIQWTGDISCEYDSLKDEVANLIKTSRNEIAYINFDCGGHIGNPNKKLYLHWMQLGAFAPIMRPHCTKDVLYSREPWVYDEDTLNCAREYINMRYHLLPMIYTNAYKNYVSGEPLIKELSYEYMDKNTYNNQSELLIGKNIIISPICNMVTRRLNKSHYLKKVKATYFDGRELKGEPLAIKEYDKLNFYWSNVSPEENVPVHDFSARFETTILVNKDVRLIVESDDGVRVYIDGELTLDDWACHAVTKSDAGLLTGKVPHKVVIEYFQGGGDAAISLFYRKNMKNDSKKVYLPKGKWIDPFTGKRYQGKKNYTCYYDYHVLPMFIRLGSIIPLAHTSENTTKQKWDDLIFDYYPNRKAVDNDFIYEDDTYSTAYKFGKYRISNYQASFNKEENCFDIIFSKSQGEFDGDKCFAERKITIKYHLLRGVSNVDYVTLNGQRIDTEVVARKYDVYPLNDLDASCDSKVLLIKFDHKVDETSIIKVFLKK